MKNGPGLMKLFPLADIKAGEKYNVFSIAQIAL